MPTPRVDAYRFSSAHPYPTGEIGEILAQIEAGYVKLDPASEAPDSDRDYT
jgi:hypothetical protein